MGIYNGRETLEITDQDTWSSIERGSTIFMNLVLVRSIYKDWRECPGCHTKHYPRHNSEKFALDWYVTMLQIDDVFTCLPIAGIVTGDCKVKIILILALTAHRRSWSAKRISNLFVTSVSTNV